VTFSQNLPFEAGNAQQGIRFGWVKFFSANRGDD